MKKVIMGNHAVSWGVQLARAEVIAAYPITPQTQIVEELSEMCADGALKARFIKVESEHSAMAACIGASADRRAHLHRHVVAGPGAHARAAALGGGRAAADRDGRRQPRDGAGLERSGPTRTTASRSATPAGSSSTARTTRRCSTPPSRRSSSPRPWTCR